jgi:hypothetical protein
MPLTTYELAIRVAHSQRISLRELLLRALYEKIAALHQQNGHVT